MKHYTDTDFVRLIDEVEAQGGKHLPGRCMADEIEFEMTDGSVRHTLGTGCEEDALFRVVYDQNADVDVPEPILEKDSRPGAPEDRRRQALDEDGNGRWTVVHHKGSGDTVDRGTVQVCANDDLMREWPRFRHAMKHSDPVHGTPRDQ